jgi:hypothetical protein
MIIQTVLSSFSNRGLVTSRSIAPLVGNIESANTTDWCPLISDEVDVGRAVMWEVHQQRHDPVKSVDN